MTKTLLLISSLAVALAFTGCKRNDHEHKEGETPGHEHSAATKYTCSMHPEVAQDKPGDCSKCGMKLVEKK